MEDRIEKTTGENVISCDLHTHSIRSACGFHTLLEIAGIIRNRGLQAFALTDHGPMLGTPRSHFAIMLRRMPAFVGGVRVFKGIEASVLDSEGTIDLPTFDGCQYDIVLAGIHKHHYFETDRGIEKNTRAMVSAMRHNPEIRIITHPCDAMFPVDPDIITDVAGETFTALEINTTHIRLGKVDKDILDRTIEYAAEKDVMLAVNSDGHMFNEIGVFDDALTALEPFGLDRLNIINRSYESTLAFLGFSSETDSRNLNRPGDIFINI